MEAEGEDLIYIYIHIYKILISIYLLAQCAKLEELNLVDATMTEDSDSFLFGSHTVYRHFFFQNKFMEW